MNGLDALMASVKRAVAARDGRRTPPPAHEPAIVREPVAGELSDRFLSEVADAGMHGERVKAEDVVTRCGEIVKDATGGVITEPALLEAHPELGDLAGLVADPDEDALYAAEVGLVLASAGIAETGSVAHQSGMMNSRSAALLPMTAVAIVHASTLVDDVYGWFAELDAETLASEIVLITGPSKSADIGMRLVTGVHGPGVVHVLLVTDR
jgi:hypothetical protein